MPRPFKAIFRFCTYLKIFIYIYIYTNFIEHNRHFLSTYFLLDPFVLPICFYRIRQKLIYVLSIVICIPSTFCPTLGHNQGKIYYKSDVTFVFEYYYYVRASWSLKSIAFAFKWVSINSVNSERHLSILALVWKLILLSVGCMFLIYINIYTYIYKAIFRFCTYLKIFIYIYIYIYIYRVSSHTEELWYNETVCLWITIYPLSSSGFEHSGRI